MKTGDIVKGKAFWPRGPKRGDKVEFETVIGTLASGPGEARPDPAMAWVLDKDGEFRAVYASTVELVIPQVSEEPDPTVRARVLDEAKRITATDRNSAYGEPEDNFQRIADYWNVWLQDRLKEGAKITPGDTAAMMIFVKMAREMNAPKEDNKVDGAGYFACWAEVDANKKD